MEKRLLLWAFIMILPNAAVVADTCHYESVSTLTTTFTIPQGKGIHTFRIDVDTRGTTLPVSYQVDNTAGAPLALAANHNENRNWNLSDNGDDSSGGVHIIVGNDTDAGGHAVIHLTLIANPDDSLKGTFDPAFSYTTDTWTFTLGFSSAHNLDVTTTALNTSGGTITPDPITVQKPTAGITITSGGVDVPTATLGAVRMILSGQPIDFAGSASDPSGGTPSYSWDFGGSAPPATPTTDPDPPAYTITSGTAFTPYTVSLTVRSSTNGATATATKLVYVKQLPTAVITFNSPSTTPDPYGDAPLAVNVGATVYPNDPFLEGGEDADANSTDYTFTWTFETGSTDSTHILGATHSYAATGVKTVSLVVTDDYGNSTTVTQTVYVTPLDRINFPPAQPLPYEPVPAIDGVVRPTDIDNNGTIDIVEMGWNNAFRATHANGTDDPVAFQCLRWQKNATEGYLLLSFEVNGDAVYDHNDVIVLTFRPDKTAAVPASDRRVFIFPVWNNAGACDAGGTGGSLTQHRVNKPPRAIQYFQDSSNWSQITTNITEAATEGDPGFFARVHSYPSGGAYSWDVEVRIPLDQTAGGTGWINIGSDFLFYADVIRVTDRSLSFGDAGYATQFRWPRESPAATGSLDGYAFPFYTWGSATRVSSLGDSQGLYIEDHSSVGVLSGTNIVTTVTLTPDASGNATVPFIARVKNNSPAPISDVNVLFRYAHWGATLGTGGDWRTVPAPNSSSCPSDQTMEPAGYDHNHTCNLQVPAAGGTPGSRDFRLDWTLNQTDPEYIHFKTVQDHQCVYAEINAHAGANILRKSTWNNVTFLASSEVNDSARISTLGCGLPPVGRGKHRVILEVKTRTWAENAAGKGRDPTRNGVADQVVSYEQYFVYAYYDAGTSVTINGQKYFTFEPIGSFGYVFHHESEVLSWINSLGGARKIREGLYVIDIARDGSEEVMIHVEPHPPTGFSLSLHGGVAVPCAGFPTSVSTGVLAAVDVGYAFSPLLSVVGTSGFNYLPGAGSGASAASVVTLAVDARFTFVVNPLMYTYAQAGPGLSIRDFATCDLAYSGGLGVGFIVTPRFRIEAGADYHSTFSQSNVILQGHAGLVLRL
ncbi:MAG TPA: PKD domain-containing protein [Spirochaetia bacterium]|nr:PKD domain-containing protein [Spirochaetia bacterium]